MDLETWAMKCSKITSADKIIGAAIIEDIAKNFEDWKSRDFVNPAGHQGLLRNIKKQIKITRKGSWNKSNYKKYFLKQGAINEMPVDYDVIPQIAEAYALISDRLKKAKDTAAKALREMEENEKKWDLAEKLLNMKRNEFGALVPVVNVEEDSTVLVED